MCIPFPEPWEREKDLNFTFYLWRLQTPLYNDTQVERTLKHTKTTERNSTRCECIFHQLAVKNVNVNVVKTI